MIAQGMKEAVGIGRHAGRTVGDQVGKSRANRTRGHLGDHGAVHIGLSGGRQRGRGSASSLNGHGGGRAGQGQLQGPPHRHRGLHRHGLDGGVELGRLGDEGEAVKGKVAELELALAVGLDGAGELPDGVVEHHGGAGHGGPGGIQHDAVDGAGVGGLCGQERRGDREQNERKQSGKADHDHLLDTDGSGASDTTQPCWPGPAGQGQL